ncbi:MAG: chromate transporter [Hyphomicrobiales bacterium]|nr:chromate transporter [Hyphomicrobiales bacterium]
MDATPDRMDAPAPTHTDARQTTPGPAALFSGWAKVGALGFGGVAAWAHRMVVEERRWLSDREYAELLGIGQALPGPNTPNICVILGLRYCGWRGAAASVAGLMAAPLLTIALLGYAYDRFAGLGAFQAAIAGAASAAAGLSLGVGGKMALRAKFNGMQLVLCGAVFVAAAFLGWPLYVCIAVFAPVTIALAWRDAR